MIANVNGSFKNFDGSIYTTGSDFTNAEIDLWIDPASIDTGEAKRDEHLKGFDFLDASKHNQISFRSNTMQRKETEGAYELWGDFTLKGITKHIQLDVEFGGVAKDLNGKEKAGFVVTGKINRSDWNLLWNPTLESGGFLVSDEIKITCELELDNLGTLDDTMKLEKENNIAQSAQS